MKLFQSVNLEYSFYLFLFFRKREGENQLVIQGGDGERGRLVLFYQRSEERRKMEWRSPWCGCGLSSSGCLNIGFVLKFLDQLIISSVFTLFYIFLLEPYKSHVTKVFRKKKSKQKHLKKKLEPRIKDEPVKPVFWSAQNGCKSFKP